MKHSKKVKLIATTVGILAIGAVALVATTGWQEAEQETDDAYVSADFTLVAPRVAGTVSEVLVEDNQEVKTGDVLARIDDRDFQTALHVAQAELKACESHLGGIDARTARQQAVIEQAGATIAADDAALQFARQNASRYNQLSESGAGTTEQQQQHEFGLRQQLATHQRDSAAQSAAQRELTVLASERLEALAAIGRAEAVLEQAALMLSYTTIKAPTAGFV
ncbi:HlyD family secretion protein, partial [Rugamonas sp.]|uniref:HlyD family secretion protein n=1 Tax=Rugamonas sp. TaxID=1926287 RepID=UPI0025FED3CD